MSWTVTLASCRSARSGLVTAIFFIAFRYILTLFGRRPGSEVSSCAYSPMVGMRFPDAIRSVSALSSDRPARCTRRMSRNAFASDSVANDCRLIEPFSRYATRNRFPCVVMSDLRLPSRLLGHTVCPLRSLSAQVDAQLSENMHFSLTGT